MNSRGPAASLPSEIWFYIHRMATADTSPMVAAYTDRFQYWPEIDPGPLRDLGQFWRAASSFVLVSRLWNRLANELLYENIRVDHTFEALLRPALERSQNAKLVRSVLLSRDRLDHNIAVLAMCPRLQVIVQPEGTEALNSDTTPIPLSSLHFLRQIYCEESAMNSGFLRRLVALAPNLESLSLGHFSVFQASEKTLSFPTIPNLRWLTVAPIVPSLITSLFKARTVQNITRFTCAPSFFSLTDLPTFPSLRLLNLFGPRSVIPFAPIFSHCPRLQELCYDIWNTFLEPTETHAPLSCIRVHILRDGMHIQRHFRIFLSPKFPQVRRLVLHRSWHRIIDEPSFAPIRDGLRAQGCVLECPEGSVQS